MATNSKRWQSGTEGGRFAGEVCRRFKRFNDEQTGVVVIDDRTGENIIM